MITLVKHVNPITREITLVVNFQDSVRTTDDVWKTVKHFFFFFCPDFSPIIVPQFSGALKFDGKILLLTAAT